MKNIDEVLAKLVDEQNFLKEMQGKIVDNFGIMIQNQQQNADNHQAVIRNQTTIIHNQEIIVSNQINIVRNQKQIVQNQVQLDVILENQAEMLNMVKKLSGKTESIEETTKIIEGKLEAKREVLKARLDDPMSL
jgi:gamma-glutamylcysteine synthetase